MSARHFIYFLAVPAGVLVVASIGLGFLLVSPRPAVEASEALSIEDGVRAGGVLRQLRASLRHPEKPALITVDEAALDSILAFGKRAVAGVRGDATITPEFVTVDLAWAVPRTRFELFFNARLRVAPSRQGLDIAEVSVGRLTLPRKWARPIGAALLDLYLGKGNGVAAFNVIKSVQISPGRVAVNLHPSASLVDMLKGRMTGLTLVSDPELVRVYFQHIAREGRQILDGGPVSGAALFAPAFRLARERSVESDPIEENKAAILALAMHFGDPRIERVIGDVRGDGWHRYFLPRWYVRLGGRHDLLRHFILSAALSLMASDSIAGALGELKEARDTAPGGSGFSFVDLAADRAGVRFARMATTSEVGARYLQQRFSGDFSENDFFPRVLDFPEWLSAHQFNDTYFNMDSAEYRRVVVEIDRRIDACAIYRGHITARNDRL